MPDYQEIATWIRKDRAELDLSQGAYAKRLRLTHDIIRDLELAVPRNWRLRTRTRLEAYFGKPLPEMTRERQRDADVEAIASHLMHYLDRLPRTPAMARERAKILTHLRNQITYLLAHFA